jgi:hypothetical protein
VGNGSNFHALLGGCGLSVRLEGVTGFTDLNNFALNRLRGCRSVALFCLYPLYIRRLFRTTIFSKDGGRLERKDYKGLN